MARDINLVIRVDGAIKQRLQDEATKRGLTMSFLGAFIIGEWLRNQDRVSPMIENVTQGILEVVKGQFERAGESISDDELNELVGTMTRLSNKVPVK